MPVQISGTEQVERLESISNNFMHIMRYESKPIYPLPIDIGKI